jgi:membrane protein required for colicin V production
VTLFDFIAWLILIVSGLTGFVRGAVREMITVTAFLLAAALALFGLKYTAPVFRRMLDPDWLATSAAVLLSFGVVYLLLRLLGSLITRRLHENQALGLADRGVGLGFGLIRAFLVLGVFNLLFTAALMGEPAPKWTTKSKLFPMSAASARVLRIFAPRGSDIAGAITRAAGRAVEAGARDNENGSGTVD